MDTIEQQIETAHGELSELQQQFVDAAHDADKRRRFADLMREKRDQITRLYLQQAA